MFLNSLATSLENSINSGLDIARSLGWDIERTYRLGGLNRVYFVPQSERGNNHEPDEFHDGIAPSVKLLHAVVARLSEVNSQLALKLLSRWEKPSSSIFLRLWSALARDPNLVSDDQVAQFLMAVEAELFWNLNNFPEISELRARRFSRFKNASQLAICRRIVKKPPKSMWKVKMTASDREEARNYWAVRELKRIEFLDADIPVRYQLWLQENITRYPDLLTLDRIDFDFPASVEASFVQPDPDDKYDLYQGEERLTELEKSLASSRSSWNDDSAQRAREWIRQEDSLRLILNDFMTLEDGGNKFPLVWEAFAWSHSPSSDSSNTTNLIESSTVLGLLLKLSSESSKKVIQGITYWLETWRRQIREDRRLLQTWNKFWPISVDVTNSNQRDEEAIDLNTVLRSGASDEPKDLDTLNTPAGRMVGLFLALCPDLNLKRNPFNQGSLHTTIRDQIIATTGRSGLIAKHRLVENLSYFLKADKNWTEEYLAKELFSYSNEVLPLWRAIARRTIFHDVLEIIGPEVAERVHDQRLGRESRQSLLYSLVVESLYALYENRPPAVEFARISQTIRSQEVEDEIRVRAVRATHDFIKQLSANGAENEISNTPENLFKRAVKPFLAKVWPQERSLVTPGISKVLASIPIASKDAFVEAVKSIELFLMPFESWTLFDYGLRLRGGEADEDGNLYQIDTTEKAKALLKLFDLTLDEELRIPYDLAIALKHIKQLAPKLIDTPEYRRLDTATRSL